MRVLRALLISLVVGGLLVVIAVVVTKETDRGRNLVRRIVLQSLGSAVHGTLSIDRIEGDVLDDFSLVGVRIADTEGAVLIEAERITANISVSDLLNKRITFENIHLINWKLRLTQNSHGDWNYERIFPKADSSVTKEANGLGDWVTLRSIRLTNGDAEIRRPWTAATASARVRDSLIQFAVSDRGRLRVSRADTGYVQATSFREINGYVPLAVVADPDLTDLRIEVDSLRMIAEPFRPPFIDVRLFAGTILVGKDRVLVSPMLVRLPDSEARGQLTYTLENGDVRSELSVPRLALKDVRALYPALPESGGGRMDLDLFISEVSPSVYHATNATLSIGDSEVAGELTLILTDEETRFGATDLRATRLSTRVVTALVPDLEFPFGATFTGRVRGQGPLGRAQLNLNGAVDPDRHPPFTVVARGGIGIGVDDALIMGNLRVQLGGVPLSLAREFGSDIPFDGKVHIVGRVHGSTAGRVGGEADVRYVEAGSESHAFLKGTVAMADSLRFSVEAQVHTLDLSLAQRFLDSTEVRGTAEGTVVAQGTRDSVTAELRVDVPGQGTVNGTVALARDMRDSLQYAINLDLAHVVPQAMVPSLPVMQLNGTVSGSGVGLEPRSLLAEVHARFTSLEIDSTDVGDVVLDMRASSGVAQIDSLSLEAPFGAATVRGTFGLVAGTTGALQFNVRVADLSAGARWIATGDTGMVAARPGVGLRLAEERARLDSLSREAERGNDPAALLAEANRVPVSRSDRAMPVMVDSIALDSIAGSFEIEGELKGNVEEADGSAELRSSGIIWGGNLLGEGQLTAQWRGAFTPYDTAFVEGGVDSLRLAGFAFDSTHFTASYHRGSGDVVLALFPGDTSAYELDASYVIKTGEGELQLRQVSLRMDSTTWRSAHASSIAWRGRGIRIDSLELRDERHDGLIAVNGELPDEDPGRLDVQARNVRIAPWLSIMQSDLEADAMLSANAIIEGTQSDLRLEGSVDLSRAFYRATPFPDVHSTFRYADESLQVDAELLREDKYVLATIKGRVPLDFSTSDSGTAPVRTARALDLSVAGDSIPVGPMAELFEGISNIQGFAKGDVAVSGTTTAPQFTGAASLALSQVTLDAAGVTLRDVRGRLRFSGDSIYVDTLVARSGGTITAQGHILVTDVANPAPRLTVTARDARVLQNELGELFADATIKVAGTIDTLDVTGSAVITRGVILIPDPAEFDIIKTADPAIFAIADTSAIRNLGIGARSATDNLRMILALEVRRGTFARSADANVELYGNLEVIAEPGIDDFMVTGALFTDQGDYTFLGKRFDVTRGSVRFLGGAPSNPLLQVLASYEVRQAGRPPLDIRVVIGGTLERPALSLESDAQPTLSQSDLISFLAFGRSSSSLLQFSGTGLEGGGSGGSSLAGNIAALATRQLASIGLNALVDEVRSDLSSATRADVLNITPAPLPADVSLGALQTVLRGTEIEIGKYIDRQTFLIGRVRPTLAIPGATLERRLSERLRIRGSLETRLLPNSASLSSGLEPRQIQVLGMLFSWKFAW